MKQTKKEQIDFAIKHIKHYERALKACKPEEIKSIKELIAAHNAKLNKLIGLE